ncbi:MAG: hypothetical protein JWQ72_3840 [Polaromonas sp.]|nr:hypothetical protein [Polaromonas sp.]
MTRHTDWPLRLAAYLAARRELPFAWAYNDCCTFAADAVKAMTGADPMRSLRGRYTSRQGAARLIKAEGGLKALVSRYMGEPMPYPLTAGRGDVVLFAMEDPYGPEALGIATGANISAPGPAGTVLLPLTAVQAAWWV